MGEDEKRVEYRQEFPPLEKDSGVEKIIIVYKTEKDRDKYFFPSWGGVAKNVVVTRKKQNLHSISWAFRELLEGRPVSQIGWKYPITTVHNLAAYVANTPSIWHLKTWVRG